MTDQHHGHDHAHDPVTQVGEPPAAVRIRALEELLVEKLLLGKPIITTTVMPHAAWLQCQSLISRAV